MKFIIKPYASALCLLSLASVASWCADLKHSRAAHALAWNNLKKSQSKNQASKEELVLKELLQYLPKVLSSIILDYSDLGSYYVVIPTYSERDNILILNCFDGHSIRPTEIIPPKLPFEAQHKPSIFKYLGDSIFILSEDFLDSGKIWIIDINGGKYKKMDISPEMTRIPSHEIIDGIAPLYKRKILALIPRALVSYSPDTGKSIETVSMPDLDVDKIRNVQIARHNPSWLVFLAHHAKNGHKYENNFMYYDIHSKKMLFQGNTGLWGCSFVQLKDGTIAAQGYNESHPLEMDGILIMRVDPTTKQEAIVRTYTIPHNGSVYSLWHSNDHIVQQPFSRTFFAIEPLEDLQGSLAGQAFTELQQALVTSKSTAKLASTWNKIMIKIPNTNNILLANQNKKKICLGSISLYDSHLRLHLKTKKFLPSVRKSSTVGGGSYEMGFAVVPQEELAPAIKRQEEEQLPRISDLSNLSPFKGPAKYAFGPEAMGAI